MARILISAAVDDFKLVLSGLRRINPNITLKKLTLDQLEDKLKSMYTLDERALENSQESNQIQTSREALAEEFHEFCKLGRAKVKGDLGDNAPELGLIGVVRQSDIVRVHRKVAADSPNPTTSEVAAESPDQ